MTAGAASFRIFAGSHRKLSRVRQSDGLVLWRARDLLSELFRPSTFELRTSNFGFPPNGPHSSTCSRSDEPAVVGHSPSAPACHVVVSTKMEASPRRAVALCEGGQNLESRADPKRPGILVSGDQRSALSARFPLEEAGQMPCAVNHIKDSNCSGFDSIENEVVCESNDRQHPHVRQVAVTAPIGDAAFGLSRQLFKGRFDRIEHSLCCRGIVACDRCVDVGQVFRDDRRVALQPHHYFAAD